MNKISSLIKNDFKVVLTDKMFAFWTVILPVIFIAIFGNITYSGAKNQKAELHIINKDSGEWSKHLIKYISSESMVIVETDAVPEKYNRILTIPENFSRDLANHTPQILKFKKKSGANMNAALQAEIKIVQSLAKLFCDRILNPDTKVPDEIKNRYKNLINVEGAFIQKAGTKIPSGADHAVPGVIVQFIMMSILVYGGVFIIQDRKKRRLERVLYTPVTVTQLWASKLLYRVFLGLFQASVLLIIGAVFFNMNMGNILYSAINVLLFSTAISALSILLGSIVSKEEIIIGIAVLLSNVFAALAGCWWPIEIVTGFMRDIAMLLPSYWAMDAFHKIIFFGTDFVSLIPNFAVMLGYTLIFALISIKYFKVRD